MVYVQYDTVWHQEFPPLIRRIDSFSIFSISSHRLSALDSTRSDFLLQTCSLRIDRINGLVLQWMRIVIKLQSSQLAGLLTSLLFLKEVNMNSVHLIFGLKATGRNSALEKFMSFRKHSKRMKFCDLK